MTRSASSKRSDIAPLTRVASAVTIAPQANSAGWSFARVTDMAADHRPTAREPIGSGLGGRSRSPNDPDRAAREAKKLLPQEPWTSDGKRDGHAAVGAEGSKPRDSDANLENRQDPGDCNDDRLGLRPSRPRRFGL